jgi:hypothetical protein
MSKYLFILSWSVRFHLCESPVHYLFLLLQFITFWCQILANPVLVWCHVPLGTIYSLSCENYKLLGSGFNLVRVADNGTPYKFTVSCFLLKKHLMRKKLISESSAVNVVRIVGRFSSIGPVRHQLLNSARNSLKILYFMHRISVNYTYTRLCIYFC